MSEHLESKGVRKARHCLHSNAVDVPVPVEPDGIGPPGRVKPMHLPRRQCPDCNRMVFYDPKLEAEAKAAHADVLAAKVSINEADEK